MKRDLSLAIGVSDAGDLPFVGGAVNGARAFHEWAGKMGYDSRLLVDDPDPVTVDTLREKFAKLLKGTPVRRLLIYFSGHGMIRDAEERLWFLSQWNIELRVVQVELLRWRLMRYYDIEQIAIFSDACGVLPTKIEDLNLSLDGVVGKTPFQRGMEPELDRFDSSLDGTAAFMLPGRSPDGDQGVFSGLLMKALWGVRPDAFSQQIGNAVTSRSLAKYLKIEVPKLAKEYGKVLHPRVSPTFGEGVDIYYQARQGISPPQFPEPQPPGDILKNLGPGSRTGVDVERFDSEQESSFHQESMDAGARVKTATEKLFAGMHRSAQTKLPIGHTGVKVHTDSPCRLWCARPRDWHNMEPSHWVHQSSEAAPPDGKPLLIEFVDGRFAAITGITDFTVNVLDNNNGISGLFYFPGHDHVYAPMKTAEALAAMEMGDSPADVLVNFAAELRYGKHTDPVQGVISAYLYDSIGDIANIRRMAYYYIQYRQPIPFDIALLSRSRVEMQNGRLWMTVPVVEAQKPRTVEESQYEWTYSETPAAQGLIGGFWPLMRQGWSFLESPLELQTELIIPGLAELSGHLRPQRFATLDIIGGRRLVEMFSLSAAPY